MALVAQGGAPPSIPQIRDLEKEGYPLNQTDPQDAVAGQN